MRTLRALPSPGGQDVLAYLRQHPRAFTRSEIAAMSSAGRVRTLISRGEVVRLLPGAYVAAEHQTSFGARADAALGWAGEGALLGGRSALFALGLLPLAPPYIEVVVPHGRHPQTPSWLKVRQVTYAVQPARTGKFRTVSVAFAIVQAYAELSEGEQSDVVFGSLARKQTSTRQLRQALATVPRIRRRRALVSRVAAAEQGAESWLEEQSLQKVFTGKHFDQFVRQHEIVREGRAYRLDMYDPFTRTCVELDSYTWHSRDDQRLSDIRRDADLAAAGILTVRLASRDLSDQPEWCRRVVFEVVQARRGRV